MKYIHTLAFGILIFCHASSNAQNFIHAVTVQGIDSLLMREAKKGFSGSVLISQHNQIFFAKGYGMASLEDSIPNRINTKFEIALHYQTVYRGFNFTTGRSW